jgi:hypothetical protein
MRAVLIERGEEKCVESPLDIFRTGKPVRTGFLGGFGDFFVEWKVRKA